MTLASGAGARADVGPIMSAVISALQGWQASADFRPLTRIAAPKPGYGEGFLDFPLAFEAQRLGLHLTPANGTTTPATAAPRMRAWAIW